MNLKIKPRFKKALPVLSAKLSGHVSGALPPVCKAQGLAYQSFSSVLRPKRDHSLKVVAQVRAIRR
jgi:hypothetical protein